MRGFELADLGFTDRERAAFASLGAEGVEPARVTRVDRGMPLVFARECVERAEPAAHLIKSADDVDLRPVVGDWVALSRPEGHDMPIIEAILPRTGLFTRKDPGVEDHEQAIVANVDIAFVVQSLSGDGVNQRRLERELVLAWESGAIPVVVLTKADLVEDPQELEDRITMAQEAAHNVEVIVESAITGLGLEQVLARVPRGMTAVLLGASGVGKSTLVNRLVGSEVLATAEVREGDDRGRHTTVAREMIPVPDAGVIIDTPGVRALALWDVADGMAAAFADIEEAAVACRFSDCAHDTEPGCAVMAAIEAGEIPQRRLDSYHTLQAEIAALAARRVDSARKERERQGRIIAKASKAFFQRHGKKRQ